MKHCFWIELLVDTGVIASDNAKALLIAANELVSIFVASLPTEEGTIGNLRSEICNNVRPCRPSPLLTSN